MFKKYPSIENHYRKKEIDYWLSKFPELGNERFVLQEKIHGSNIQIIFDNDNMFVASRNRILDNEENFYDVRGVLQRPDYAYIVNQFINLSKNKKQIIRLYGEIFGKGVQKGVDYNVDREIRFFDISYDGIFQPENELSRIFSELKIDVLKFLVPVFAVTDNLQDAVDMDIEFNSKLNSIEGNIAEGVVIKPADKVYVSQQGSIFYLKKKNEKFNEKQKSPKQPTDEDPVLNKAIEDFNNYINENRIQSHFSKEGEIENPSQTGNYIKGILDDVKEDFLRDNGVLKFDEKDLKLIFKSGTKEIVKLLRNYL